MFPNFFGAILFSLKQRPYIVPNHLVLFDFHSFFIHNEMWGRGRKGMLKKNVEIEIWMFTKSQCFPLMHVLTFYSKPHNDKLNKQIKNVLLFIIFSHVQHGHCLINHKHMSWKVILDETNLIYHQNILEEWNMHRSWRSSFYSKEHEQKESQGTLEINAQLRPELIQLELFYYYKYITWYLYNAIM